VREKEKHDNVVLLLPAFVRSVVALGSLSFRCKSQKGVMGNEGFGRKTHQKKKKKKIEKSEV